MKPLLQNRLIIEAGRSENQYWRDSGAIANSSIFWPGVIF